MPKITFELDDDEIETLREALVVAHSKHFDKQNTCSNIIDIIFSQICRKEDSVKDEECDDGSDEEDLPAPCYDGFLKIDLRRERDEAIKERDEALEKISYFEDTKNAHVASTEGLLEKIKELEKANIYLKDQNQKISKVLDSSIRSRNVFLTHIKDGI
jgi:hypothetical protein